MLNLFRSKRSIPFFLLSILAGALCIIFLCLKTTQHHQAKPLQKIQSTNLRTQNSTQPVKWEFSESEMALFKAALRVEKKEQEVFYHVAPSVKGYVENFDENHWEFTSHGQRYIAFSSSMFVKLATEDGSTQQNVLDYEIFKPDGSFVATVENEEYAGKKLQVLVQANGDGIQAHTFTWDHGELKPTEKRQSILHLKYPYVENPSYAFADKWANLPLNHKIRLNYFSGESLSLSSMDIELKARKQITPDEPWDIHYLISKDDKLSSATWLNSKTKVIQTLKFGDLTLKPCSQQMVWLERTKNLATWSEHSSSLNFWLVDTEHLEKLKLRFVLTKPVDKALFVENDRQKVHIKPTNPTEIIVTTHQNSDPKFSNSKPLHEDELEEALKSTRTHQSDDPGIKAIARHIVRNETVPSKKALLLAKWVKENIRWTYAVQSGDARETLKSRIGDCSEHSTLFVALARAVNIPARYVGGYLVGETDIGSHAWAEIYDHGWKEIDPSSGQWVGANYIRMEHTLIPSTIRKLDVLEVTDKGKTEKINSNKPYWWYKDGYYYNRAIGLVTRIPSNLSYHVERFYENWLFQTDKNGTHYPIAQGPVNTVLFSLTWVPQPDRLDELFTHFDLFLSDMYVSLHPHAQDLYNNGNDLAPNAVFDGYRHVESWQEKHGPYLFAVDKFRYDQGRQGIHYRVPLNNRIDMTFVIYGPFGAQQGHPKAPDAILDLLHSTHLVKPDIEGHLSLKNPIAILNSASP